MIIIHIQHKSDTFVSLKYSGHTKIAQPGCAKVERDVGLGLEDQDDRARDDQATADKRLPGQRLAEEDRGKHQDHHQA